MTHITRQLAAGFLSVALLLTQGANASDALGWDISGRSEPVSQGLSYATKEFWSDTYQDKRTEHVLEYQPNSDVVPVVAYGDNVLSRHSLSYLARGLEAEGKRVVGGVNGDLYVLSSGAPLGLVVTDGVLRSSSSYHYAAGFKANGTVIVGKPDLSITVGIKDMNLNVLGGINKVRNETDGYFLLTPDFHTNSQLTGPGIEVVLRPVGAQSVPSPVEQKTSQTGDELGIPGAVDGGESGQATAPETTAGSGEIIDLSLRIGQTVVTEVVEVRESGNNNPIPADAFILTIHENGADWHKQQLMELTVGEQVNISISSPDGAWDDVDYAVGGMWKLVSGGAAESGLPTEQTARTAIGVRADGSAVFYTIDGRQSGLSVGASLGQIANRLIELGCTEAIGLDGGGSTTFGAALPYESAMTVKNSPSDGSERINSNAVFFVSNLTSTGSLEGISVHPESNFLLAGSSTALALRGYDSGYYSTTVTGDAVYSAASGTVLYATYTAPNADTMDTVSAQLGGLTATAQVRSVTTPDEIRLYDAQSGTRLLALSFEPGETVALKANALKFNTFLTSQNTSYTWTLEGDCGTIDQNGVFTASEVSATGKIIVSAGGTSLTMDVNVVGQVELVDGLEETMPYLSGEGMTAALEQDLTNVRFGEGSLRLDYETIDGRAYAAMPQTGEGNLGWSLKSDAIKNIRYLGLWVYGDGSENTLSAIVSGDDLQRGELELTTLDFVGWKHILVPKTAETTMLFGFIVDGNGSGAIRVDQMTIASEAITDITAPIMTLELEDGVLRGVVADNVDRELAKSQISLTLDGAPLEFQWNTASGSYTATIPSSTQPLRRVRLTAVDASGNIGAAGLDVTYTPEPITHEDGTVEEVKNPMVFADTGNHWAESFADYLYYTEISTGVTEASGLYYYPDRQITRQEFFTLAARFLGLNTADYAHVALPFVDAGDLADWARPVVQAMYEEGYLQGSAEAGGLYLFPQRSISRAEAMTILGRMQPRGYEEALLDSFADGSLVGAWAAPYVKTLVGQEIVSGYGGYLNPSNPVTRGEVAKMLTLLK